MSLFWDFSMGTHGGATNSKPILQLYSQIRYFARAHTTLNTEPIGEIMWQNECEPYIYKFQHVNAV